MMLFSTSIHATLLLLLLWHFSSFYSHPRIEHWHTKRTKQISTIIINERPTKKTKTHQILQKYWWWQNHTQIIKLHICGVRENQSRRLLKNPNKPYAYLLCVYCDKYNQIFMFFIPTHALHCSFPRKTKKVFFCLLWNVHCFFSV